MSSLPCISLLGHSQEDQISQKKWKNKFDEATELYTSGWRRDSNMMFVQVTHLLPSLDSGRSDNNEGEGCMKMETLSQKIPLSCRGSLYLEFVIHGLATFLSQYDVDRSYTVFWGLKRHHLSPLILLSFCHFYKKNITQVTAGPKGEHIWSNLNTAAAYKLNSTTANPWSCK